MSQLLAACCHCVMALGRCGYLTAFIVTRNQWRNTD